MSYGKYEHSKSGSKSKLTYYREMGHIELPEDYYTTLRTLLDHEIREQFVSANDCEEHKSELRKRFFLFMNFIEKLDKRVKKLEEKEDFFEEVEIREVSVEEAKDMIMNYLKDHPIAYPDDIADVLRLDLKTTIKAVKELIGEEKIEEG